MERARELTYPVSITKERWPPGDDVCEPVYDCVNQKNEREEGGKRKRENKRDNLPGIDIEGGGYDELPQAGNRVCETVLDGVIRELQNLKPEEIQKDNRELGWTGYKKEHYFFIAFFSFLFASFVTFIRNSYKVIYHSMIKPDIRTIYFEILLSRNLFNRMQSLFMECKIKNQINLRI